MHLEDIAIVFAVVAPLIGIIYANLRSSIKRNGEVCNDRSEKVEEWQDDENKFKLDIIDRLARIETGMNGGKK